MLMRGTQCVTLESFDQRPDLKGTETTIPDKPTPLPLARFDQRPDLKGTETPGRRQFAAVDDGFDQRPDLKGTETNDGKNSHWRWTSFDQRPDLKGTETASDRSLELGAPHSY